MSNLSPSTLALLRAAKTDAPTKHSRAAIWGGVTSGLVTHTPLHITPSGAGAGGAGAGTSTAPAAASALGLGKTALLGGTMTTMKAAFIGALFGSAISIGVATVMLRAKPVDPAPAPGQSMHDPSLLQGQRIANPTVTVTDPASLELGSGNGIEIDPGTPTASSDHGSTVNSARSSTGATVDTQAAAKKDPASARPNAVAKSSTASSTKNAGTVNGAGATAGGASFVAGGAAPEDLLVRESALVSEARRDLLTGDAASALKATRAARALEARQLEPEEMSLEARALRALGRDSEAEKIESSLRALYPGQGR